MHRQCEVSSPQEQGKGSHLQSHGITEVVQVNCSRERGEDDVESRQGVCCVLSRGFWRASHLALQCYISIDVEGPPESFFEAEGGTAAVAPAGDVEEQQQQQAQQQQVQQNDVEEELPATI